MKSLFNQLFDYNFYCNRTLIEEFEKLKKVPEQSIKLFNHILNAHHLWNHRILQKKNEFQPWDMHSIQTWQDIHHDNQRTSFEIVTNADDFEKRIDYETTEGGLFTNDLKDILFHIINHSTHHRGQILADLRTNTIEPKELDYIFYKR